MESIEQQIAELDWNNGDEIIALNERNQLYFDNYQSLQNKEKIYEFVDIKIRYAYQLYYKSHFDKLDRVTEQIGELLSQLGTDHPNYKASDQHYRFLTGMSLSNRKNYKKAYPIFKELANEDPEHYYYKVWKDHTQLSMFNWLFNILTYLGLGLIILDLGLDLDEKLSFDPGTVGLVLSFGSYLTQQGLSRCFNKKKATNSR